MTTPETLTEEERKRLEWELSDEDDAPDGASDELVRKLLRIHDALQARVKELEQLSLDWLEWGAREASGFDDDAIALGERSHELLADRIREAEESEEAAEEDGA